MPRERMDWPLTHSCRRHFGRVILACSGFLLALGGCIEVPKPPPRTALDARKIETSKALTLETVCVPTGIELCFDAFDNNCNGVIDEGCGLRTGTLQFTLAWSEPAVDIDLNVTGPHGELARLSEPNASGLLKDRDCPGSSHACHGQNIENVVLAEGHPEKGRYQVVVRLEDDAGATLPIAVRLSARIGHRHFSSKVILHQKGQEEHFDFSL